MTTITPTDGLLTFDDGVTVEVDSWSYETGPTPDGTCLRVVIGDIAMVLNGTPTGDGFELDPGQIEGDPHERLRAAYLGIPDGEPVPTQKALDKLVAATEKETAE